MRWSKCQQAKLPKICISMGFLNSCCKVRRGSPLLQWGDVGVAQEATAVCICIPTYHKSASWQGLKEVPKPGIATDLQVSYEDAAHIETCFSLPRALQS